jgi:hypothetical protein
VSVYEALGMFWVILATVVCTITLLVSAIWAITIGLKVAMRRYKLGESLERALAEPLSKEASHHDAN